MHIVQPSVELIWITPNAEEAIELAGRLCYKSEGKIAPGTAAPFIREKLIPMGHLSVIEHASASLKFICDRGVSHEIVRHRTASYSQESTRYCNYGKERFGREISVIQPPFESEEQVAIWTRAMLEAERAYMALLDVGAVPQMARSVLPTCLKTEIVMTANFREWLHFFALRCDPASHPQMREVACLARDILAEKAPSIFGKEC